MGEIIKEMLNHPIATIALIVTASSGIANIISAAKGNDVQPFISINSTKTPKDN